MKKYIYVLVLLTFNMAGVVFAGFIKQFTGWNDLIEQSPDIIIAKCTSTLETSPSNNVVSFVGGNIPSEITVLSVLKGNTTPGSSRMMSQYWPYPGEQFLLFANFETNQSFTDYSVQENYQVIPLDRNLPLNINFGTNLYFKTNLFFKMNIAVQTNLLTGKPLKEQIQWVFNNRVKDLHNEMARDANETKMLEDGLRDMANVSSNAPPAVSKP